MNTDWQRARTYFRRAMALKCPECGTKPVFLPLHKIRCVRDYFAPLDGCPRCGYAYERETGYFLLSIWAINYGCGSILGIAIYVALELTTHLSLPDLLASVLVPVVVFNLLFVRHSKSLFLALDHFFDPHRKDGPGDGGCETKEIPKDPVPRHPVRTPEPAGVA